MLWLIKTISAAIGKSYTAVGTVEDEIKADAEAKVSAGGSRWFNGEKEVTVQMERSTVVLRSARLELLEMEEAAGDEDLPLLLTVQKSLLLM
ncbi:hypothetical protein NC651_033574 [Populus alba x Populus x berolinensis]|nr:hypothetical protein NC651_033574 [Populus alba x Populus x berolinensis]